jgi:SAM-dependent methyltransferase
MRRVGGWGLQSVLSERVRDVRIRRVTQWVRDFAGDPAELRILDLGAYEGRHSMALAELGAEVVAIEGREEHVANARASAERLGLSNLTIVQADVRDAIDTHGTFDVVLCLGLLYHLPAAQACELVETIATVATDLAIIETQVSLSPKRAVTHSGHTYWGMDYPEDTTLPAASLDNETSFWLTKPSLLNLLTHAGFSSVAEAHVPNIASLAAFEDHVALLAKRGEEIG